MYIKTLFNEMKSQVSTIQSMINSINADVISEKRNSNDENWTVNSGSVAAILPADSLAKIERLGSLIGMNVHNMILFLGVYDFKYYLSLVK
jgi:hypothetical protein